jgi:cell division protein ZapA
MNNNQEISIRVQIADRQYPLKAQVFEEEYLRKSAKLINEKLLGYSKSFSFKDKQDLLAMVCLEFATDALTANNSLSTEDSELKSRIDALEKALA